MIEGFSIELNPSFLYKKPQRFSAAVLCTNYSLDFSILLPMKLTR